MYSLADIVRLRVARTLRDDKVSLQTLRHVVALLAGKERALLSARYVILGKTVRLAETPAEVAATFTGTRRVHFGFVLELTPIRDWVVKREARLIQRLFD